MSQTVRPYTFPAAVYSASTWISIMVLIHFVQLIAGISLAGFGILPRDPQGAIGIVFSPLLHGNVAHLLANSTPLFILLTLLYWDRTYHPSRTFTTIWLASGIGTWLIGRAVGPRGEPVFHIGASSLIYGIVAYLIVAGFMTRKWRTILVSLIVFVVFGGIVYGMLPQKGQVSWEGHLAGAVAGVIAANNNHGSSKAGKKRVDG